MSSRGILWARSQTAPSATAKAILLLLGELSEENGRVFKDQQFLADILQLSREATGRNLAKLEEAGLITRQSRYGEGGRRLKDIIRLCIGRTFVVEAEDDEPCDAGSHGEESHVIEDHEPCDAGSHTAVTQDHSKTKLKDLTREETNTPDALFEASVEDPKNDVRHICQKIHEGTRGAWSFKEAMGPVKWALGAGYAPEQVLDVAARVWKSGGRVLTKAVLAQAFEGISVPGVRQPKARVPLAVINHQQNNELRERLRQQEQREITQ